MVKSDPEPPAPLTSPAAIVRSASTVCPESLIVAEPAVPIVCAPILITCVVDGTVKSNSKRFKPEPRA